MLPSGRRSLAAVVSIFYGSLLIRIRTIIPTTHLHPRSILLNPVFENCKALTFDLFGTVLDLGGSLTPHLKIFLDGEGSDIDPAAMWQQLRYRQRIEQYQDTLVELGHSGYLETVQKAFDYVARANKLDPTSDQTDTFMAGAFAVFRVRCRA